MTRLVAAFIGLLGLTLFSATPLRADDPTDDPVRIVRGLRYYEGPEADPQGHQLDLYLPRGRTDFPVLVFLHGGGWTVGDKDHFGIYTKLGRCLARHGIGMVSANYRLSPSVRHPEHIRDVARAFAWTRKHIARYGGRPDELFVGGHSAGGHLAALLTTDKRYLEEVGLSLRDVLGTISLSGVLDIPPDALLNPVFGKGREGRKAASPITHCSSAAPPFLIIYAEHDLRACDRDGAEAFCRALREKGGVARTLEAKQRNHISVLWKTTDPADPVARAMVRFIEGRVLLNRLVNQGVGAKRMLREIVTHLSGPERE